MIHESYHWKKELARDADIIERWCSKRPTERQGFILERKTFLAAYAVRKLAESHKLTDEMTDSSVPTIRYPKKENPAKSFRHLDEVEDLYDFDSETKCTLAVKNLVNTIIHSLYFSLALNEQSMAVTGFFVTSDFREKNLWYVAYAEFASKLRAIAENYPTSVSIWIDENGKEQRTSG